jgi:hypothetical protein
VPGDSKAKDYQRACDEPKDRQICAINVASENQELTGHIQWRTDDQAYQQNCRQAVAKMLFVQIALGPSPVDPHIKSSP